MREQKQSNKRNIRWMLISYDIVVYAVVAVILLGLYSGMDRLSLTGIFQQICLSGICIFLVRFLGNIYGQVWRYGGIQCYIRLLFTDAVAFAGYLGLELLLPIEKISFARMLSLASLNLLGALALRMMYRYAYKCSDQKTIKGKCLTVMLRMFAGIQSESDKEIQKIKVAIIGAGRVGVSLAEELLNNSEASYLPRCFIDVAKEKVGREIHDIPVYSEDEATFAKLGELEVQEIIFAIPSMEAEKKKKLYNYYKEAGYKLKVYDYPTMYAAGGKRHLREFDIEELLFRKPIVVADERTNAYYKDKVVLITGGGGSIGSELCRQLAKMKPKKIIILDIYENGAYDVQQELKIAHGNKLDLQIEICSITHKKALNRVFDKYHPQIIINAAAHKHVPLMEHNCIEAIYNNVFGTKNLVDLCEEYHAERFMMVSTDKAVNPTNVMGATKRMCEMIVQSASTHGTVKYSATRFGNVLGSAGSVIPLFKRQIANGGPVTITDKRIIRYFMTIPEASQLVLQSGALAHNGELFVLDMGQSVKIIDLAENMIRLSGVQGITVQEIGLRPGEKLFEELLVKTEELDKTDNSMIFIERDTPLSAEEIQQKLEMLKEACDTGDDLIAKETLRKVVPTFKKPEEVNKEVASLEEKKERKKTGIKVAML
ncbi:polysaccharide biosynthesis protein [[Ruminococcus] lactaris]|uniref:Polysaccharide biosynthesis protein n=1 Tax=[Ruminococcus] lactaris TaxID=46228 RepID=A0A3E4LIU8_9FIRM|nr:nucleoside-diphosphate sugar epimerase/dehydratase [[Ruminococcus] lactaris]RGK37421.1 polysaccharide biosynthesis protein [[Ruminococcus] lactaris]